MCMVDDGDGAVTEISGVVQRVARVKHTCRECHRTIDKGETYFVEAYVFEGDFTTHKTCAHCKVARDWLQAENERLREEIDALRTDAERYRWLREHKFKHNGHCFALTGPILWETTLDAAIDEAMKQAALQGETAIWSARHDPRE